TQAKTELERATRPLAQLMKFPPFRKVRGRMGTRQPESEVYSGGRCGQATSRKPREVAHPRSFWSTKQDGHKLDSPRRRGPPARNRFCREILCSNCRRTIATFGI